MRARARAHTHTHTHTHTHEYFVQILTAKNNTYQVTINIIVGLTFYVSSMFLNILSPNIL